MDRGHLGLSQIGIRFQEKLAALCVSCVATVFHNIILLLLLLLLLLLYIYIICVTASQPATPAFEFVYLGQVRSLPKTSREPERVIGEACSLLPHFDWADWPVHMAYIE